MSGTPKRSHEEVGHSSSASKHVHEEVGGSYPKLVSGVSSEYNPPFELGPDGRVVKIARTESRDVDRRSPMHSLYRVPSDSHVESHAAGPESKLESRDSKDSREHWGSRSDVREPHGEAKKDWQGFKGEKDCGIETRGDDGKETKHERDGSNDLKNDVKGERDWSNSVASHAQLNLRDPKELLRLKRYAESPGVHIDPWHVSRGNLQGPVEFPKGGSVHEDRDYAEAHEAIGENKFDPFKEKDRKKKDMKHREWGDRDKESSERRSTLQVGNSSSDGKESGKEDKEMEKWEKEKKERENLKEREKEQTKRETTNALKKEVLPSEKELGDASTKMPELECPHTEQKKQKDFDGLKNVDREAKDRRKERDGDVEMDRTEKQSRLNDKESDEILAEGEGTGERDKEALNYGAQQRRRMLRSRGSPQLVNRDPRFRERVQDNEGTQGKPEVSSLVYKVGECMQDLVKLWKEYESSQSDKNGINALDGPTLEIRIPAEHVTATNRQVRGGQLWGTDIYTNDSDLVAVLMHTGYCRPTAAPPPSAIQELRATIRVLPPQDSYTSMLRNNVRSRAWGAGIGCSYRVERCCILKKGGGSIDLEPCLTHSSAVEPTLAPVAVERTMTTRAAASNALRQQRFVREVTIQYNLCNEPWIKYGIGVVADKGLKKPLYTSARLKKGEVLYLETHTCRYELCFTGEKLVKVSQHEESEKSHIHLPHSSNGERNDVNSVLIDSFRWSRCKRPLPQKIMRSVGIPLPPEYVEILEENLDWEDVQWSQTGVWIAGKEYNLARVHFLSPN